jgi:hypothetical protein
MPEPDLDGPAEAAITDYLGEVSCRLAGPRRMCTAILDELHDGLTTAVLDRRDRGMAPPEAVAATLHEFGPPDVVAAAFAGEIAVARARRTVVSYLATGPLVGLPWLIVLTPPVLTGGIAAVWAAVPAAPAVMAAAVAGVLVLVAAGRVGHHLALPGTHTTYGALALVIAAAAGDVLMLAHVASLPGVPTTTLGGLAIAASTARLGCSVVLALGIRGQLARQHG